MFVLIFCQIFNSFSYLGVGGKGGSLVWFGGIGLGDSRSVLPRDCGVHPRRGFTPPYIKCRNGVSTHRGLQPNTTHGHTQQDHKKERRRETQGKGTAEGAKRRRRRTRPLKRIHEDKEITAVLCFPPGETHKMARPENTREEGHERAREVSIKHKYRTE